MKERGLNLPSLDDILFTSEEERQDAALEMATDRKQAALYQPDHDLQISGKEC